MKKSVVAGCLACCAVLAFAKPGDTKYVSAQTAQLKSDIGFFAKNIGTVSYGEKLTVEDEKGSWTQIRPASAPDILAWIANANITARKIISETTFSNTEIALAGKGFSKIEPGTFNADATMNTAAVSRFVSFQLSGNELKKFISQGKLHTKPAERLTAPAPAVSGQEAADLGNAVAASLLSVYTELDNPAVKTYLNLIVRALAGVSPVPELPSGYTAGILDTDEINAFATSSGIIMVTRGLIRCAQSEDALAAVLAHELAHIQLQHSISAVGADRKRTEIRGRIDSVLTDAFGDAVLDADAFAAEIRAGVDKMANNGYSKIQEFEADTYAVKLLKAAGYDAAGMEEMLGLLRQHTQKTTEYRGGFMTTHPDPDARLAHIKPLLAGKKTSGRAARDKRYAASGKK